MYLTIDTGGAETLDIWDRNHTSNTAFMWRDAGADLAEMGGMDAPTAAGVLARAIGELETKPDVYRPMEPANGWGSYESCLDFLRSIRDACVAHPKASLRVSH